VVSGETFRLFRWHTQNVLCLSRGSKSGYNNRLRIKGVTDTISYKIVDGLHIHFPGKALPGRYLLPPVHPFVDLALLLTVLRFFASSSYPAFSSIIAAIL
jgi:hypothetical protein